MKSRYALATMAAVAFVCSCVPAGAQEAQRQSLFGRLLRQPAPQAPAEMQPVMSTPTPAPEASSTGSNAGSTAKKKATSTSSSSRNTASKPKTDKKTGAADKAKDADVKETPKPEITEKKTDEPVADKVAKTDNSSNKAIAEDPGAQSDRKKADDAKRLDDLVAQANNASIEFLHIANKGLYNQALLRLAPAQQAFFTGAESAACGTSLKGVLDHITRDGSMQRWNVASSMRGEGCRITADITYKDGRTSRLTFEMQLVNSAWRMILPDVEKPLPALVPVVASAPVPEPVAALPASADLPTSNTDETSSTAPADIIASLTNDAGTSASKTSATDTPWRR